MPKPGLVPLLILLQALPAQGPLGQDPLPVHSEASDQAGSAQLGAASSRLIGSLGGGTGQVPGREADRRAEEEEVWKRWDCRLEDLLGVSWRFVDLTCHIALVGKKDKEI